MEAFERRVGAPSGTVLPRPEARLVELGRRIIGLGRGLLASGEACLLTVAVGRSPPLDGIAAVMPWDRSLTARMDLLCGLAADPRTDRLLVILEASTIALGDSLWPRWPSYACPAQIVIVTDGTGLAFTPNNPPPFGRYALPGKGGVGTACDILPFDPSGAWAQLRRPAARSTVR